ncbi:MAG: endonuclease V, partial [Candidatus Woesearchaeota archaeon]|nr:endonuclease V [Candidatus Woesearchaeota archaeon]
MINFNELKKEQLKLAKKVITADGFEKITTIAGADQAYVGNKVISSIVVCDYKTLEVIEKKHAIVDAKLPYKSGFLFYRDGPAVMEAFNKLDNKPDVLIV